MIYCAIIVEDEEFLAEQLKDLISANCAEIKIVGMAYSASMAEEKIKALKPDLVFMDIEMPDMNAFELLKKLKNPKFDIIFTTAHSHYALQAFDHNAVHYLLKPINKKNIKIAVQKYIRKKQEQNLPDIAEILKIINKVGSSDKRIRLPKMGGFTMMAVNDINRLEAEGRYTKVYLTESKSKGNNQPYEIACLNIKEFEEQLCDHNFFRCHHSHIVNLKNVKAYQKGEGGTLVLKNGETIPVSKSKKDELLKQLNEC